MIASQRSFAQKIAKRGYNFYVLTAFFRLDHFKWISDESAPVDRSYKLLALVLRRTASIAMSSAFWKSRCTYEPDTHAQMATKITTMVSRLKDRAFPKSRLIAT